MKKILAILLAVFLFALVRVGLKNAEKMQWYTAGVSLRYEEPLQSDVVHDAHKQNASLTFWCQQEDILEIENKQIHATIFLYNGDMAMVWGQPLKIGSIPSPFDESGCVLSSGAAYALFGSENVVGLFLKQGNTTYVVRGIFESNDLLAILPVSTAAFTAVEIPYTEALWQDPDTQVTMLSQETGLPTPQWQLYPKEIFAIMQWTLYIPILFSGIVLLSLFAHTIKGWTVIYRDGLVFLILLLLILALPFFFQVWPQWLTPSRWSDFSWWRQVLSQLKNHFYAWLSIIPSYRDVCIKTIVLCHLSIIAGQCILCEWLRCGLQKIEKLLPQTL